MLRYAALCHAMPRYAMLCYAVLCCAVPCRVVSRRVVSRRVLSCPVVSCRVLSYRAALCRAASCCAVSCRAVPCCVVSHCLSLAHLMLHYDVSSGVTPYHMQPQQQPQQQPLEWPQAASEEASAAGADRLGPAGSAGWLSSGPKSGVGPGTDPARGGYYIFPVAPQPFGGMGARCIPSQGETGGSRRELPSGGTPRWAPERAQRSAKPCCPRSDDTRYHARI